MDNLRGGSISAEERYKKLVDPDSEIHAMCSQRKQRKEKK